MQLKKAIAVFKSIKLLLNSLPRTLVLMDIVVKAEVLLFKNICQCPVKLFSLAP